MTHSSTHKLLLQATTLLLLPTAAKDRLDGRQRCSVANLTRRVGTRLVVHLVVVLQQLLLVNVLVAALVLHKLSGLREERAVVVARAEVLCKTSELTKVESAVSLLLLLLLVVTIVIVIVIVVFDSGCTNRLLRCIHSDNSSELTLDRPVLLDSRLASARAYILIAPW